ncbi:MAG: M50 family metallopeptidase [Pseudomonadota bacterium]
MSEALSQGPLFLACLILMLGVVVIVHELGHYLAGRAFGAASESFSVGFGKSIFERTDSRGTRWRINWVPLGGFVKFVGEAQGPADVGKIEQGPIGKPYNDLSVGQRSIVAMAGPAANFLLAIVLFAIIALVEGSQRERVIIDTVGEGTPAAAAGFQTGDVITSISGRTVENVSDFLPRIQLGSGKETPVVIERGGAEMTITVIPERTMRQNAVGQRVSMGTIGAGLKREPLERKRYNPVTAVGAGVSETLSTIDLTTWMLGRMIMGQEPLNNLTGPVGIGDTTRRVVKSAVDATHVPLSVRVQYVVVTIIKICALVSVGIGFFNLLPLPVLDGGHLVFNAYEAIAGKALPAKVQEASLTVGLVLLLGMVVFVTWGDIIETGIFQSVGS